MRSNATGIGAPGPSTGETMVRPQDRSPAPMVWDSHHRLVVAVLVPVDPSRWSQSGLEYRFSLGILKLPNGQALSYTPLEMGWRFPNGWRLRLGAEFFYYTGYDQDKTTISQGLGPQLFYYSMYDVRISALYEWPWHSRLRPLAGVTFESVLGTKQLSYVYGPNNQTAPTNAPVESANSFEAPGAELGLEYRGGPTWSLSLEARYVAGLGYWANMAGTDFGVHYLF